MLNNKLHYCIIGLGVTGISCLKFLTRNQVENITATDLQDTEQLRNLMNQYPNVQFFFGELFIPEETDVIILSPGIDKFSRVIQEAILNGAILTSDINLFIQEINFLQKSQAIQLAAVTGTNGKTTVVNILAKMAEQSNIRYALCGNVGEAVLDYLPNEHNQIDLYIIELSSFQLELVENLTCDVACILNMTPDHLDRYQDFSDYCQAKLKIYQKAKNLVYYREDLNTYPTDKVDKTGISFGKKYSGDPREYSLDPERLWLMRGDNKILAVNELGLTGEHNLLNCMASLAIGELLGFEQHSMYAVLKNFKGLAHRYQIVAKFGDEITWINDSKATNIGATLAAINTTVHSESYHDKNIIIILGGLNKNVELNMLKPLVITYCKAAILIGECKVQLYEMLHENIVCTMAEDLNTAVVIAKNSAVNKDIVLLSPACASFDMFDNYEHRGEVFKQSILALYNESRN